MNALTRQEIAQLDAPVVRFELNGREIEAPAGTLVRFEPDERHSVSSELGARLLLLLAPWPGIGHYRGAKEAGTTG